MAWHLICKSFFKTEDARTEENNSIDPKVGEDNNFF